MSRAKCVQALARKIHKKIDRHGVLELIDILPRDMFHDHEHVFPTFEEVVDGDDIGMLEAGELGGFANRCSYIRVAAVVMDSLDGNPSV